MPGPLSPAEVRAFFDAHRTVRRYQPTPIPAEHLEVILYAAQRAPTDATAQMYSIIRLRDPELRAWVAEASRNPHLASAPESFIICADVARLRALLELRGYPFGEWPATAVHFAIGDAVMAAENMRVAAEMLGYQSCWIGGILNPLHELCARLELPEGVFPFAGLTLGLPDEQPGPRPRLSRDLVLHTDRYRLPENDELEQALTDMAPITARGDWAQTLARYFAVGGTMELREGRLRDLLARQGFGHAREFDTAFARAEALGFPEVLVRRRGESFEAWVDRPDRAHRGESASSPSQALRAALEEASRDAS
ncbi:nitroreductase [Deinobacterium chartae]|uniref:Nitroreductase n=1 Tax=Deinobacterium chartae TaxID=521158 RepID=A0A841I439_9DEIO|nr:nitroreductase [Deinobacterium chartae]